MEKELISIIEKLSNNNWSISALNDGDLKIIQTLFVNSKNWVIPSLSLFSIVSDDIIADIDDTHIGTNSKIEVTIQGVLPFSNILNFQLNTTEQGIQ
jgi:hypothetical protein